MGIKRVRTTTDEFFHEPDCGGMVKLEPWIPRGGDTTAVMQLGGCDRCGIAFCDPGGHDVTDDDLEAGQPA